MDENKEFDVKITISAKRSHAIATGKEVGEVKAYEITDMYSKQELIDLVANLTPVTEETITSSPNNSI